MNREEKTAVVEEIASQLEGSEAVFAIDYRGISVPQAAELRSRLRESDSSFRVSKNRLAKLAADKAGRSDLNEFLQGPTALTFVRGDMAQAAKTITTFTKEHNVLTFKGGYMGETLLDEPRFKAISVLPPRDVLNAQLANVVASPIAGLVRGLNALISGLALQLGQIAEQGLVTGEAPATEAQAAEETEDVSAESKPDTPGSEAEDVSADEAPAADAEAGAVPADETPGTPGGEAEDVPADETPTPDPEASASDSPTTDPEEEPSKE